MDASAVRSVAVAPTSGSAPGYFIADEATEFRECFNTSSFKFRHRLGNHPLFDIPHLVDLAKKCVRHPLARPDEVYYDIGDVRVDQRWNETLRNLTSPEEVIERISTAGAWMLIRRAELVDEYRVILDDCMSEIERMLQIDLKSVMEVKNAIVFITSPKRITAYHIDRECNFLLQVSGDKHVSVFDKTDRLVLPEVEIERFWAIDNNAAIYKPELQDRARVSHLEPGDGVHIPVNAPHWVRNGDTPSVSLSINFQFRSRTRSDVYRANYYLRKLGLRPMPPGQSEVRDAVKRQLFPVVRKAHVWVHSLQQRVRHPPADRRSGEGRGPAA